MDLGTSTLAVGAGIGVALTLFGAYMLLTGRAPVSTAKAFRQIKDAALYHLLFGLALMVLVLGVYLPGGITGPVSVGVAVALAGVALVRYRPRARRTEGE